MLIGMRRRWDVAWLYHVPVCMLTLAIYGLGAFARLLGRRPAPADRTNWQKEPAYRPGAAMRE